MVSSLVNLINHKISREFIPHFDNASQYKLAEKFNFFKVNCSNKSLCSYFGVKRYPTIKVFYQGKEIEDEPGRDLVSVLEYIDKLTSSSLIEIESHNEINNFGKLYGESSFVMVYDKKDSDFYKCVNELAENYYKTIFYIGCISIERYNEGNEKPKLIVFIINNYIVFGKT